MGKFVKIAKIKKDALDKIENELAKQNSILNILAVELKQKEEDFFNLEQPKDGDFSWFKIHLEFKKLARFEIEKKIQQIEQAKKHLNNLQLQRKEANIEYEKFNYLSNEENKKLLYAKKVLEQKDMDEVAIKLYFSNKKSPETR